MKIFVRVTFDPVTEKSTAVASDEDGNFEVDKNPKDAEMKLLLNFHKYVFYGGSRKTWIQGYPVWADDSLSYYYIAEIRNG